MRHTVVALLLTIAAISPLSYASDDLSAEVEAAKNDIAKAAEKGLILSGGMKNFENTPYATYTAQEFASQLAQELATAIDSELARRLKYNTSCSQINSELSTKLAQEFNHVFTENKDHAGNAELKAARNFGDSFIKYIDVRCRNLTE